METIEKSQSLLCLAKNISKILSIDITEKTKKQKTAYARFIYYKLAIELGFTYTETAKAIGYDHTCVVYGIKQFNIQMRYKDFRLMFEKAKKAIA